MSGSPFLGTAVRVASAVLGAGTLLIPTAFVGSGGAPLVSLVTAGCLLCWCLLIAAAGGSTDGGSVEFVRARLGDRAATALVAMYFAGFVVGQAAIATAAGGFAAQAAAPLSAAGSARCAALAAAAAAAVLVAAAVAAARGVTLPPTGQRLRLACALVLAGAAWLRPDLVASAGGSATGALLVALPVLFAWVGLESSVPGLRCDGAGAGSGGNVAAALGAVVAVAALYATLLAPLPVAQSGPSTAVPVARAVFGVVAATVCGVYCLTNLRAMSTQVARLRGVWTPGDTAVPSAGVAVAASAALAVLAVGTAAGLGVGALLLGPGAMTAAIYLVMAAAALRPIRARRLTPSGSAP
jgi:amino acid efflux transporter